MDELTTWRGKDIEKMSREELLKVVQDMGKLLGQAEKSIKAAYGLRRQNGHYTGLPRR